ncbi:hypothetical protein LTR99_002288 [Exophiala xenobiotica]|uniref:Cytochrome P450 n=1 Tax=Vermiconidia calcicola TaxID=1690605 RepID=A0AAV9QK92_9PEZI|nr:hypothetical protein H2202_000665 [Exophiala xenobiotica]KAK5542375.1 hypothetical protein LTR25_002260 [Vermiconidia calcicola]KAK5546233.1 hypothetical protein LTR23_003684 [Chaetothyriales sp. CCFEE 6169]KAK5195763.1 hypothetical protein LTR92_004704 [Exophiala xenobiotica]KAK5210060.1 hypothetical protein LTR41_004692 [Exophiala xenobiotica]
MAVVSIPTLLSALAVTILYFVALAIYRIYFHPLAKYPGPILAKLTQWPEARSAWQGRRFLNLHLMHEEYGDVVRFAPNKISFRTTGALHDIYADRRANVIKTGWTYTGLRINPGITTQLLSDRQLHAARRRLLNNAFAEGALKNLEKYILANIRDWCNYLGESKDGDEKESGWSKERDLGLWATLLTFDVLGDLCFGSSFGAMKNGFTYIQELIMSSSSFQQSISFLPIRELVFPLMKPKILLLTGSKNIKQKVLYRQRIGALVQKRFALENANADKSDEDQRKDFFHHLLNAKDPETGEKFKPTDLVGEAALLVGAGADTSSTAMSACFFYLMRTPRALSRLQEQVRSAFGDVEEIKYGAKLISLSYLRGCIDEAMRMSPPVPGLLDRLVLPGGADIDGHTIPEGMVVGVPIYTIHHNEKYYPRPYEFLPERWIAGSDSSVAGFDVTPESVEIARSAFNAFSCGPRNCVGKNMAYMELFVAIARTIWLFDIRLKEGDHTGEGGPGLGLGRERSGEYQLKDWLISERYGPVLEFRKRTIS